MNEGFIMSTTSNLTANFTDQVVVVTGGTRGIGRGIVEAFLNAGAKVIATYAGNETAAEILRQDNLQHGSRLDIKRFDVSNTEEVDKFYHYISETYKEIHVLINNSGIRKDSMASLMPDSDWDKVISINLSGTFYMTKRALEFMRKGRYGRVVNISSVGGNLGLPGQANYSASKAAVVAMSKSIAKEMGKRGITINNVLPGFIETDLLDGLPEKLVEEYTQLVPLKRFGKVCEVASAVLYLASKDASYINGASLEVSGGL